MGAIKQMLEYKVKKCPICHKVYRYSEGYEMETCGGVYCFTKYWMEAIRQLKTT